MNFFLVLNAFITTLLFIEPTRAQRENDPIPRFLLILTSDGEKIFDGSINSGWNAQLFYFYFSENEPYITVRVDLPQELNQNEQCASAPRLLVNYGSPISFSYTYESDGSMNSLTPTNYEYEDLDSYEQQKSFRYYLLQYNSEPPNEQLVYIALTSDCVEAYNYALTLKVTQTKPCLNYCNEPQGTCVEGQCQCASGFIDEDCSRPAVYLDSENTNMQLLNVNSSSISYLYTTIPKDTQALAYLTISTLSAQQSGTISVLVMEVTANSLYYLPTLEDNEQRQDFQLNGAVNSVLGKVEISYPIYYNQPNDAFVVFGLALQNCEQIELEIQINLVSESTASSGDGVSENISDNPFSKYILYVAISLVTVIGIVLVFVLAKKGASRQTPQGAHNHNHPHNHAHIQPLSMEELKKAINLRMGDERVMRMLGELDRSSKIVYFRALKWRGEKNPECSICLVEYEERDELREIICSHIFHRECIDQWLYLNQKCPICRQVYNHPESLQKCCESQMRRSSAMFESKRRQFMARAARAAQEQSYVSFETEMSQAYCSRACNNLRKSSNNDSQIAGIESPIASSALTSPMRLKKPITMQVICLDDDVEADFSLDGCCQNNLKKSELITPIQTSSVQKTLADSEELDLSEFEEPELYKKNSMDALVLAQSGIIEEEQNDIQDENLKLPMMSSNDETTEGIVQKKLWLDDIKNTEK